MRARNREVNIFNMSLLDILTGMLGAFLFLMLGLVPYYIKAQHSGDNQKDKTPHIDTLLTVIGHWDSSANVNLYLYDPDAGWCGTTDKKTPFPRGTKISQGACNSGTGWQNASTPASENKKYLVAYWLPANTDPKLYSQITCTIELMTLESDPDGKGIKTYCPLILCRDFDASGAKPNVAYAAFWISVTKDSSKDTYFRQYSFTLDPVDPKDKLPDKVQLPPAPVSTPSPSVPTPAPPPPPPSSSTSPFPFFNTPSHHP